MTLIEILWFILGRPLIEDNLSTMDKQVDPNGSFLWRSHRIPLLIPPPKKKTLAVSHHNTTKKEGGGGGGGGGERRRVYLFAYAGAPPLPPPEVPSVPIR